MANWRHWLEALALVAIAILEQGCAHYEPKPLSASQAATGLEDRTLDNAELKTFIATNAPELVTEWPRSSWDFGALTLAGLYYHSSLDVARAQWKSSRAGVVTAGARPNPSVSVTPEYTASPASGLAPWIATVQFDVPIETAGKRRHRIARAEHLTKAAYLQLASTVWKVRSDVRASLVEWTATQRSAELLHRQQQLQSNLLAALEQRLAAGAGANSDVVPARVALSKTVVAAGTAKTRSGEAKVRLAQALGLPAVALGSVVIRFDLSAAPAGAERFTSVDVRRQALQGRADVLAALAEYAAADAALRLEIARQYPDVHLSPGYQYDQGENKWGVGLAVELPVLNQNQGPIAQANSHRAESAARFTALQARIIGELDGASSNYLNAREQLAVTEKFVSAQMALHRTVEQQIQAGEADPLDRLNSELERIVGEIARLDALSRLQQAIGQLEDAIQQPLDALDERTIDLSRNPRPNR